ncbi:O-antigen ligase family protein [Hymenobacter sp. BT491]|uniref:O-antigen ligase family protein n=1 Tax=Hymenobacter sp. BT491 TaxID=2766779 RepID=UPI001653B633|nr:O-antigen ligase family protein [Hymenobacter sp. BT491]MBC6990896.1 O-antigen ligase family protein [Hymenobacter sp. BT491]
MLSQQLLLLACVAGVVGLLASRALVALSPVMGVLAVLANPRVRRELPRWLHNGAAGRMALLYILLLISALYTDNWPEWRHQVFRQLPFIGVPLAFCLAVPLTNRQRFGVGCSFVLGVGMVAAATLLDYIVHPPTDQHFYMVGKSQPAITGIFHIHFGIMLVLSAFFGLLLSRSKYAAQLLRWLLWLAAAVSVVTLHMLAYRTGLMLFYIALFVNVLRILFARQFTLGILALGLFVAVPFASYRFLPSVRDRAIATRYDIDHFYNGEDINNFSLSKRLAAWHTARAVARQHLLVGVGPADAQDAMMAQYRRHSYGLLPLNWVMIHNQYLHYLVASGLPGLFVWLLVLLGPLAQPTQRRNPYVYHFLLILGAGMLVDSLLEMQIGFNLFVFLYGFLVVATERSGYSTVNLP